MQAVILAAGKSTRTYPLTLTRPKPLLPLANKPLLAHTLDRLKGIVSEAIIVVGYMGSMIEDRFGYEHEGIRLKYVDQQEQLGTGHALLVARPHVRGKFIAMAGDDLYAREDILACADHGSAILVAEHREPERFGVIMEENGILKDIIEKPASPPSNLINTSFYVLQPEIFGILSSLQRSERGEYELTDAVNALARKTSVHCVKTANHVAIGYPWDLLGADGAIRNGQNAIGKDCLIEGEVVDSSIGDSCIIKGRVRGSVIMDNVIIEQDSVIEHSIIGSGTHFWGIIRSAKEARSIVNGKSVPAGEFGAAVGDNVTAKNVDIAAGCKIWPGKTVTGAITKDIS
ncbi:TPA: NTP transferase domain-containing protein [Candidatus Woesearchaeota archaeon]|nr:NTP transferase domain-containing protein [Candidatus Woesearchaeota archaeon]